MSTATEAAPLLPKDDGPAPAAVPQWKQYYKLTRLHLWPAGSILFFWPCSKSSSRCLHSTTVASWLFCSAVWAITMSAYRLDLPPKTIAIQAVAYLLGNTVRHNVACIWNDICDRDFDRQVGM